MTLLLISETEQFSEPAYCAACKKAVDINDPSKVSFLLEQAADYVPDLSPSFHGEMAVYAYLEHRHIAKEIIKQCSDEQIAAAPSRLLEQFAMDGDFHTMSMLVEKGISGGTSSSDVLHMLTYEGRNSWMAEHLLQQRMWVNTGDYRALNACVENGAVGVAKLLLDKGMDFECYRQMYPHSGSDETIRELGEHWQTLQEQRQEEEQETADPQMGGMNFG